MKSPFKVILPPNADSNPYLGLLTDSLRAEGIEVGFLDGRRLPFLRQFFKATPADIVHLQWQHRLFLGSNRVSTIVRTTLFFLQVFTLKARGVAFVWTVHNLVNHEGHLAAWELRASRMLARRVDKVIVHCDTAAREVATTYRIHPDRIAVVPHGHYGDAYPGPIEKNAARRDLGLAEDGTFVLFFGQIREYKGVSDLIEAFRRVKTASSRLVVVGEPKPLSVGPKLMEIAGDDPQITLRLEHIDEQTLVQFISACDMVALPYAKSLMSGASVLAATMARPVLAPRLGCMAEMPEDSGIFYDGTARGLDVALMQAFKAPLDKMGVAAANYVLQYPWSYVATKLGNVYKDVLRARQR